MATTFNQFMSQLSETNATLDYFVDFTKVKSRVHSIELKLNQLNYLIGKDDLEQAVQEVYTENPKAFEVLDVLIAVRSDRHIKTINSNNDIVPIKSYFTSPKSIVEYLINTGLSEVFRDKSISNLVDYVFGVEVGLDSNARKNRAGNNMAKAVAKMFEQSGIYYLSEVEHTYFSDISSLGVDVKRFDFVIKTQKKTYLIETNFYNGSGSKLNEVARAYSDLAPKINQYNQYEFVWITDGQGWHGAKNKLEEALSIIPSVYNLTTLSEFITKLCNEQVVRFSL